MTSDALAPSVAVPPVRVAYHPGPVRCAMSSPSISIWSGVKYSAWEWASLTDATHRLLLEMEAFRSMAHSHPPVGVHTHAMPLESGSIFESWMSTSTGTRCRYMVFSVWSNPRLIILTLHTLLLAGYE